MISDGETKEYVEKRLAEVANQLQTTYQPMHMRLKSIEIAQNCYRNDDGEMGDKTASGMIDFADEIYKYIMEGTENENS